MDFTQAGLLIAAVYAIMQGIKKAVPQLNGALLQLVVFIVGIGVTFLVAYSTYADAVTVGGHTLDTVNSAGLILIGLLIGGGATVLNEGYGSIKNIGQNHDKEALKEAA